MLTANEIYLLNESLDGNDIYGINKVEALKEKVVSQKNVLDSLKEKKILNDDNTINPLSYMLIKSLEKFKKAKAYIWVNDILLSEDNSQFMVLIRKHKEINKFEFKKTTNFHLMLALLKDYEFLQKDNIQVDKQISEVKVEEFIKEYIAYNNNEDFLILRREVNAKIPYLSHYVTYVNKDNMIYKYNLMNKELYQISSKEARIEISKLLKLEVN